MKINALIVDDHELVRVGIVSLLNGTDIKIVGEAASGAQAIKQAAKLNPDVILLDVSMPEMDGLETLEKLRAKTPEAKVIVFSNFDNPTYVARSVSLGASDYLLKSIARNDLIAAITSTAKGESPSAFGEMKKVAAILSKTQVTGENDVPLTNREAQVLRHVAFGLSNREIGGALKISIETVKEHVQNILRKIGMTDRTQAAVWAVRKGLV